MEEGFIYLDRNSLSQWLTTANLLASEHIFSCMTALDCTDSTSAWRKLFVRDDYCLRSTSGKVK